MTWLSDLFAQIKLLIIAWMAYRAGKAAEAAAVTDAGQKNEIKVDNALLAARKDTDGTVSGAVDAMRAGKF